MGRSQGPANPDADDAGTCLEPQGVNSNAGPGRGVCRPTRARTASLAGAPPARWRRGAQAAEWGERQSASEAGRDIGERDATDSTRATSPLVAPEDAITLDSGALDVDAMIAAAIAAIEAVETTEASTEGTA